MCQTAARSKHSNAIVEQDGKYFHYLKLCTGLWLEKIKQGREKPGELQGSFTPPPGELSPVCDSRMGTRHLLIKEQLNTGNCHQNADLQKFVQAAVWSAPGGMDLLKQFPTVLNTRQMLQHRKNPGILASFLSPWELSPHDPGGEALNMGVYLDKHSRARGFGQTEELAAVWRGL
ncbi:hypothetical protein Q8A73_008532 [Channa argus]|nr:hypothetical protein Q8A73_008532 [Channa argus]